MRVPFGQLLVRSDSYPDGGRGDALRRSSGDNGLPWADPANLRAATRSESRAGSESTVVTPTRPLRGELSVSHKCALDTGLLMWQDRSRVGSGGGWRAEI